MSLEIRLYVCVLISVYVDLRRQEGADDYSSRIWLRRALPYQRYQER